VKYAVPSIAGVGPILQNIHVTDQPQPRSVRNLVKLANDKAPAHSEVAGSEDRIEFPSFDAGMCQLETMIISVSAAVAQKRSWSRCPFELLQHEQ
jgi:hypothetical protein